MGRRFGVGLAGLLTVVFLTASAAAGEPERAAGVFLNNFNQVPWFVAIEKGFFLKHGLDMKHKMVQTGQEASKAMSAGEAQFGGAAFSNLPVALERGFQAVSVVGMLGDATNAFHDENLAVVARKESGVRSVEDLAGKKVGTAVGGTGDEYLRLLLKVKGVPAERVSILNVPPGTQVAALQGGQVDAIAAWEPYGTLALSRVAGSVLVSRGGGHLGYFIVTQAMRDVVQKRPDLVERFVAAMAGAAQYARQHRDETSEITTRWIPGLDLEIAKQAMRYMAYDPRITRQSLEAWDFSNRILIEQKKLKAPVPASQAFDLRFIEKVMREHPQYFSGLKAAP
jgi:ABC-type nitrate/sulfonate/bicarbonate transport system substrate-binding protein